MKPGVKRLINRFENRDSDFNINELTDDIKAMKVEAPELADIMKRMVAAEVANIRQEEAAG